MDASGVAHRFEDRAERLRADAGNVPRPLAIAMRRRASELELEAYVFNEVMRAPAKAARVAA